MSNVKDIREFFKEELEAKRFTTDKTGSKTIELIGASFIADEEAIFGKPNKDYIDKELMWYMKGSTNIFDIYSDDADDIFGIEDLRAPGTYAPAAWKYAANKHGEINSNYGHLIFAEKYHNQYDSALRELTLNKDTRRATMVYTRPSIWHEYNENGKSDFICTNAVTYYIRDNKLHAVVQMRSNDVVFGYKNDYAWQRYVMSMLIDDINESDEFMYEDNVEMGDLVWQVQNLHVYERHFNLVK